MGVRYDVVYATKELSRVLSEPTKTANDMLERALLYVKRTQNAYLSYSSERMHAYTLPPTRKKPTDVSDTYNTDYNVTDEIVQEDEQQVPQTYLHQGPPMHVWSRLTATLPGKSKPVKLPHPSW
jgi:hypothetical protein